MSEKSPIAGAGPAQTPAMSRLTRELERLRREDPAVVEEVIPSDVSEVRILEDHPMADDTVARAELDARLEAAEARADAKLANMQGDVKSGFAQLNAQMQILLDRQATSAIRDAEILAQGKTTLYSLAATILAVGGLILAFTLTDHANIVSAFNAGIAAHTSPAFSAPSK